MMFKSVREKRLILIILWIIAIFIAVIKLPSITSLVTSFNNRVHAPSQIAQSKQLINANRLQHGWGRRLNHTSTAEIVYNRRHGKITSHQQTQINRRINRLQKRSSEYGIQKIIDLNSDRNGTDELKSPDKSTEMVKLSVTSRYQGPNANVWADEIKDRTQVPSLRTSITSPQLLKAASIRSTINMTFIITIVGLFLSSLAIGIIFKSLIAPVISLITLLITDLITLSLSGNLVQWTGFNEYTPLTILITILIVGTLMTYFITRAIADELPRHRDANNAVKIGLNKVKKPVELSGIILTIAFGATIMVPEVNVRTVANLGITFAILTLAELTIGPIFISWLGSDILWPSHNYTQPSGHKLWNRLARLSLWQPLIGLIAVIYFIVPFAYSYHGNVNYQQDNNVPARNQAYLGGQRLNAHFTAGKSTPVTIYIKNSQKFSQEKTLKPIDDLTTKLQSMPGVNAVYSVTQPSGMPINKYYVNHQLTTVNDGLNQNQNQLVKAQKQLATGKKKLVQQKLGQIETQLNQLKSIKGQVPQNDVNNQLKGLNSGQRANVTAQLQKYSSQMQSLNTQLNRLSNDAGSLSGNVQSYQNQIKAIRKEIASTIKQIQRVNGQLNTIYSYLSSLQRSSASHRYFITPDQIQDTDFQQSLINFTNHNQRITKIQVIFNQAPSTRYNQARLHHLKNEIKTEFQGTPLSHNQVALSGVPIQQATIHRNFKSGLIMAFLISLGVISLGLILISRSVLHPLFWLLSLIISTLAGLQITELIIHFTTNQTQFNWQILLSTMTVLAGISTLELVPLSLAYRHRHVDLIEWLHEAFTSQGQFVSTVLIITIIVALSLFSGMTYQAAQFSLIIITTIVIFNWVLPLIGCALGKYVKTLPHSRL